MCRYIINMSLSFRNLFMKKSYIIAFWCPIRTIHPQFCLDYFIPFFQKYGDIQCMDFQSRNDPRTMYLLQQADLVVIGLPAASAYFYSFFCNGHMPFSNVCYAILDYFPCQEPETSRLCQQYRIPEQLTLHIPYNIQFLESIRLGQVHRYLNAECQLLQNEYKRIFLHELCTAGFRMLNALYQFESYDVSCIFNQRKLTYSSQNHCIAC